MTIHYSQNRLPMAVQWTKAIGNQANDLHARWVNSVDSGFAKHLDLVEEAIRLNASVGDLFTLVTMPGVTLSPSARSFVLQTAKAIGDRKSKLTSTLTSWISLLEPDDSTVYYPVNWTATELEVLKTAQNLMINAKAVTDFVNGPGIGSYFDMLRIWLGTSTR